MKDGELKKEDEALKAERAGGKDQASETGEAKEAEASDNVPETQEGTPSETEKTEEIKKSTEQVPANKKEGKKGFFKKEEDPRDEKIEEFTDRVRRQMAEFENFRKRADKEESTMCEMGAEDTTERVLPVIDNFKRGLATMPEDAKETPLAEGMEKIYKQFRKTLEGADVKAIEAVGREFDLSCHNAVMHADGDSLGESIVAEELQRDYIYRDSAIRHNMIKVTN